MSVIETWMICMEYRPSAHDSRNQFLNEEKETAFLAGIQVMSV